MNQRGSALVEFAAVGSFLAVFTGFLLFGAYAVFARAHLEYRTEQALYCLAEGKLEFWCRRRLNQSIDSTLPYGRVTRATLGRVGPNWKVALEWKVYPVTFAIKKALSPRQIRNKRDLRW